MLSSWRLRQQNAWRFCGRQALAFHVVGALYLLGNSAHSSEPVDVRLAQRASDSARTSAGEIAINRRPRALPTITSNPIGAVINIGRDGPREWNASDVLTQICRDIGGLGIMRYPGGTTSDNYNWRTHKLVDPSLYPFAKNDWTAEDRPGTRFNFDEFMSVATRAGSETMITVNMLSAFREGGTPAALHKYIALARDWVKYAKAKGYKVSYWEISNEPYWNRKDFGNARLPVVARRYAQAYKAFRTAMKEADPSIKVGIVGPLAASLTWGADGWWPHVMAEKPEFDFVSVHSYLHSTGLNNVSGVDLTRNVERVRRWVGDGPEIMLTEFNMFGQTSRDVIPIDHALAVGEMVMRFAEGGATSFVYWPFREQGHRHPMLWRSGAFRTNTANLMRLFTERLRGSLFALRIADESVYGIGASGDDHQAVFLVNRATSPRLVDMDFGAWPGSHPLRIQSLVRRDASGDALVEWNRATRRTDITSQSVHPSNDSHVRLELAPRSFTVVSSGDGYPSGCKSLSR